MIKVVYFEKDGSVWWECEVKKLRTAVECIREDMKEIPRIAKAVIYDEQEKKILEVKA